MGVAFVPEPVLKKLEPMPLQYLVNTLAAKPVFPAEFEGLAPPPNRS